MEKYRTLVVTINRYLAVCRPYDPPHRLTESRKYESSLIVRD